MQNVANTRVLVAGVISPSYARKEDARAWFSATVRTRYSLWAHRHNAQIWRQ